MRSANNMKQEMKPQNNDIQGKRKFDVSVIIATKNRHKDVKRSILSIIDGTHVPDEIIVMDQSDNLLTKYEVESLIKNQGKNVIKYYKSDKAGLSVNRNDALLRATGDFIASADDDVSVNEHWLENMLKEWETKWNYRPVLITGRILPPRGCETEELITAINKSTIRTVRKEKPEFNALIGAHFGASRELFESLGRYPFDETLGVGAKYPGADDSDFGYRVLKAGYPIVYEPSIYITHYTTRINDWRKVSYMYAVGSGAAMAKHFYLGDTAILKELLLLAKASFAKFLKAGIRLKEPQASGKLFAFVGLIIGFIKWNFYEANGNNINKLLLKKK